MAARNILLVASLIGLYLSRLNWRIYKGRLNLFYLFCLYLLVNLLFFSSDIVLALQNFKSEWLKFILYFILGLGSALLIIKCEIKRALLWLGVLFSFPLYIHLGMTLQLWLETPQSFPWGYLGLSTMHGELAYASLAATIFLSIYLYFQASKLWEYLFSIICLTICILSPAVAKSRGGLIFSIALILIASAYGLYKKFNQSKKELKYKTSILVLILIFIIGPIFFLTAKSDPNRWHGISGRVQMGIIASKAPFEITCKGVDSLTKHIDPQRAVTPEMQSQIGSVIDGDGARALGAFSGLALAIENPLGINQSRQAYQIALRKHCNSVPFTTLSHSHNGWINTALAIGIPGALLLLLLYAGLAKQGYESVQRQHSSNVYALALVFTSGVWFLRGMVDATMQDQMLEMQAFSLSLLLGLTILSNSGRNTGS